MSLKTLQSPQTVFTCSSHKNALVAHSSIAPHRRCNGPQGSASITA